MASEKVTAMIEELKALSVLELSEHLQQAEQPLLRRRQSLTLFLLT